MPRSRPPYPDEYREQILSLYRGGRSIRSLARDFEPSAQTIRNWVKQGDIDQGERDDELTTDEKEELRRLRRQVKQLKMEREILERAAVWFAKKTDPTSYSGS